MELLESFREKHKSYSLIEEIADTLFGQFPNVPVQKR